MSDRYNKANIVLFAALTICKRFKDQDSQVLRFFFSILLIAFAIPNRLSGFTEISIPELTAI